MQLKDLLKNVNPLDVKGNLDQEIKDIACDSRLVIKGSLFVCIKGYKVDGNSFVNSAIKSGAICIVTEKDISVPESITLVKVGDSRVALAQIANNYYNYPSRKFNLIGVTGTNGKTTTTYLVKSILESVGHKVGLIGTIENIIGSRTIRSERTTPDCLELQKYFKQMVDEGVNSVVMEVSSHSLDLHRVDGSDFDVGIFTNLTQDHLDFHGNLDNYLNAKVKLFNMCRVGVVNIDDKSGLEVIGGSSCEVFTYGINNKSDIKAENVRINSKGVQFKVNYLNKEYEVFLAIPGEFTVYNALGAIGACIKLGIPIEDIVNGLKNTKGVPGRSEVVTANTDFTIIIDYAHTPDGIENIISSVKKFAKGRIITLFGCGGDRDKTKRPLMGEIAGRLSDFCIITSDNPRSEEPVKIIKQIEAGIIKTECKYTIIENRRDAIEYAMKNASKDDIILLLGKGHETYQVLRNETIHFDEREIIQDILKNL